MLVINPVIRLGISLRQSPWKVGGGALMGGPDVACRS